MNEKRDKNKAVHIESTEIINTECLNECEDSLRSHEILCDITDKAFEKIFKNDEIMKDIPYDITIEEIQAQIALVKGQSITVYIKRGDLPKFKIVVPESKTTVATLKKAIRRYYELDFRRQTKRKFKKEQQQKSSKDTSALSDSIVYPIDSSKISWKYIWRTNYLQLDDDDGTLLINDNSLLSAYGVRNKCVLKFVRKTKRNNLCDR